MRTKFSSDEERREYMAAKFRARYENPEFREKKRLACAAYAEKKRIEKAKAIEAGEIEPPRPRGRPRKFT